MNKMIIIAVLALAIIGVIATTAIVPKGIAHTDDAYHDALNEAIANLDYDAWCAIKSTQTSGKVLTAVTKENFAVYKEMHDAKEAGDIETEQRLRAELGLGSGQGTGCGGTGGCDGTPAEKAHQAGGCARHETGSCTHTAGETCARQAAGSCGGCSQH